MMSRIAEIYQTLLEQAGYNVAVAHNGKEALDLAAGQRANDSP